ncbi:MAG: hypothetical protein K6G28_04895 [Acholeplasmatales bacterium]|nr:hypothetical protein [Acholeplasmatales bacterium]
MKYFVRKIYFSMFVSILLVITVVTTTFAWYSTQQNAVVSDFTIGIGGAKNEQSEESGLELSVTGLEGSFKDTLEGTDVMRAILLQRGYENAFSLSEKDVKNIYSNLKFTTVSPNDYKDLTNGFHTVNKYAEKEEKEEFFSLDLYVSINNEKYEDIIGSTPLYFATEQMATSPDRTVDLLVGPFNHPNLGLLPNQITVNATNAARMGVVTYKPVEKYKPQDSDLYSSKIYSFSSNTPTIRNGVYNFGGMNNDYNMMLEYYNRIMKDNYNSLIIPDDVKERGEDQLIYSQEVFPSSLGCTTKTMVKLKVYFWLEGWDSDCFNAINHSTIDFSIQLVTSTL